MEVDCEGCAGCCLDWRPLAPDDLALDAETGYERVEAVAACDPSRDDRGAPPTPGWDG